MPVTLVLRRWGQENQEFKASLAILNTASTSAQMHLPKDPKIKPHTHTECVLQSWPFSRLKDFPASPDQCNAIVISGQQSPKIVTVVCGPVSALAM